MLERLLDDARRGLLAAERSLLSDLASLLARADAPAEERATLAGSAEQLDGLFLLVVAGEFNAGKSALINALLGRAFLEEGVTPTTSSVGILTFGESESREPLERGLERLTAPVELLRELSLVDTPGTNAVLREHEALTREFVPRADLVLFVTAADRPYTESERAFLETIRDWGKKVVLVVNRKDLLEPAEVSQVTAFVRERAAALVGALPVFAVSARQALRGRRDGDAPLLATSGLPELEAHVRSVLDETGRFRLKLLNPIGVGERLLGATRRALGARLDALGEDLAAVHDVEEQLTLYREDLARDFRLRLTDAEALLWELEERGRTFFEEMLRASRVFELMNRERVRGEFVRRVVADLPVRLETRVGEVVDWMVSREQRQWQGLLERLARRAERREERLVGRLGPFERDRARLVEEVRRTAQRAVEGYDHAGESQRLAQTVRDAVAAGALLQVGAVGLGAVVATLASTTFADVTGLLAAGTLSLIGLLLLPARRRRAEAELRRKVAAVREKLGSSLSAAFASEVERSLSDMRDAVAPYARFVRAESDRLRGLEAEAGELGKRIETLRARIEVLR